MPFYVKKKNIDNFMCLLEFECTKRLKAHSRAIPGNAIIFINENAFENVVCQNDGHFVQGEMS